MTKRKCDQGRAVEKAKERMLFTAPKNVATETISAQNVSCSPLLRIPLEISNKIWEFVLGDRLIHLEYLGSMSKPARAGQSEKRRIWRHIVCQHDCPENEMVEDSTWTNTYGDEEIVWRQPHHCCDVELAYDIRANRKQWDHESMDLTALRVCRQIYNEASNVLWTTNTFSFNDAALSLYHFMAARTTQQKRLLRRLRLQMDWVWGEEKLFNLALDLTLITSLTGLRSLRLQINHSMEAALYQEAKASEDIFQTRHLEFVHKMAILPLAHVEVFVGDRGDRSLKMDGLWTAEDRIEYAEGIRRLLLDPKGAESFTWEQEESE